MFDVVFIHLISNKIVGHCVAQIHLIFEIQSTSQSSGTFLAYLQRFDVIPQLNGSRLTMGQLPDATLGLYVLK